MPIKFGQIEDAQLFVEDNGEFKQLGRISDTVFTELCEPEHLYVRECYFSSAPIELRCRTTNNLRAFFIYATTGNDLYLRFPKKLRRKKSKRRFHNGKTN